MPRKSRRAAARYVAKSKEGRRRKHAFVPSPEPVTTPAPRQETPEVRSTARPRTVSPSYEYRYILGELKRIGVLTAGVFLLLLVLALLLR